MCKFCVIFFYHYNKDMGPFISICLGIFIVWWVKNRSNQYKTDKKVDYIIGWLLIGGGIGYLFAK